MAHVAERAATYEDLLAVPENLVAAILFGRLVTHPRPAAQYASAATALGGALGAASQLESGGSGGWVFVKEPKLHLGPHVVVPDLAAWQSRRLAGLSDSPRIDMAPDWVCEVLSRSTEGYDRCEKRTIYAKAGVGHLWLVAPRPQMLEVFELREGKWLLLDVLCDNAVVQAAPFQELRFALGLLWPLDAPPETSA